MDMRFAIGALACAAAVNVALADPPSPPASPPAAASASTPAATSSPATSTSTAAPAQSAAPAESTAAATKSAVDRDKDIEHFTQEGFKPEMRHGQELYCRKDTVIGSRLASQKTCGTIDELKLMEMQSRSNMEQAQQRQSGGPSSR
jgi:hypothetical protein